MITNEQEMQDAKERLHKMIDDADEGEVEAIISALHMGQQVTLLIREAGARVADLGEDEAVIAATFITHKCTGQHFGISVQPVTSEQIANFEGHAFGCGHTTH